ncbi:MAG: ABC transporter substrate-binding protein [Planctomycetota bacterium]
MWAAFGSRVVKSPAAPPEDHVMDRGGRKTRGSGWRPVLAAMLGIAGASAAVLLARAVLAPPDQPVRLAINTWVGYEFAVLARELGYYEEEGAHVRLLELTSLGDVRRAYERGQADGMFGTTIELVRSRGSGRDPVPVLVADFSLGADVIIANEPVSQLADLRGMRIGVETGTLGMYVLMRALDSCGLSWQDVQVMHIPHTSQAAAMETGEIDAVVTFPPNSTELLAEGSRAVIFSSADIPGEVVDLLSVDAKVLDERRREIDRVLRAYFRALAYAESHPQEASRIMSERLGISSAEVLRLLETEVRIVGPREQGEYIGPDGKIRAIIGRTELMLDGPSALPVEQTPDPRHADAMRGDG